MTATTPSQDYEDISEREHGPERLAALRALLEREGLDGLLVPRTDEHQSEYLPGYAERVAWLTGFTGSNAFLVVLREEARVFTDGRYTLQVRAQTIGPAFTPDDMTENPVSAYLAGLDLTGQRIGFDPWLHTIRGIKRIEAAIAKAGGTLVPTEGNLIDRLWADQPGRPDAPIVPHPLRYAGQPHGEKISAIASKVSDAGCDTVVLPQADGNAWLFNLRGSDVPQKPMFLSYALIGADGRAQLFVDPGKLTSEASAQLEGTVEVHETGSFESALEALGRQGAKVMVDPATVSKKVADTLKDAGATLHEASDPMEPLRARKNATEQAGARAAHVRDGVAVTRFLAWFEREAPKGQLDEIAAAEKLLAFRIETGALRDIAFTTISGAGANGAIVHYRVTTQSNAPITPGSLYLTDSGGQYLDGTTDITRTLPVGEPSDEHRRCYTLVLKGHIALARARFPKGTSGAHLDTLARQFLWQAGLDFAHGTGHGVGSYLGVHEGPARIAKQGHVALEPGMLLSNEPGYYREGAFGIRLENLVLVTEETDVGGDQPMLGFETITRAPFEPKLIDTTLMLRDEITWLNAFHADVHDAIAPHLEGEDLAYLERACAPLKAG
ncbi:MAG: aminopeptidase P family protein [Devosiaceae bacterium]|nr:aminopeptidase P family protein [Devosiaceae bacterium MH13]